MNHNATHPTVSKAIFTCALIAITVISIMAMVSGRGCTVEHRGNKTENNINK